MSDAKASKPRCYHQVYKPEGGWPSWSQCQRTGTVKRDGKWYCKQHDPEMVAIKATEAEKRLCAEFAARRTAEDRKAACVRACEGMADPEADVRDMRQELETVVGFMDAYPATVARIEALLERTAPPATKEPSNE